MNRISFFISTLIILFRLHVFAEILLTDNPPVDLISNSNPILEELLETLKTTSSPSERKVYACLFSKKTWLGEHLMTFTAAQEKSILIHKPIGSHFGELIKTYEITYSITGLTDVGKYKFTVQELATQNINLIAHWIFSFK